MTLRKLTEEKAQQLQTLKQTFAIVSDNIEGCPWFGPVMTDHLLRATNHQAKWAAMARVGHTMDNPKVHQNVKDDYELYHNLLDDKYNLLNEVKKELEWIHIMIAKRTISDHQIQTLTSHMTDGIGIGILDNAHYLNGAKGIFGAKGAAHKVYNFVYALRGIPAEPEPIVPRTFYLANTSDNKTDREGLPFFYRMVDGVLDTTAEVSMTEQAKGMRTRRYGTGPTKTHEDMLADEKREAKQRDKRGAAFTARKKKQRAKTHATAKSNRDEVRRKNKDILKELRQEQDARREKLIKDAAEARKVILESD